MATSDTSTATSSPITPNRPIPLRLLVVEDVPDDAALLVAELELAGYALEWERVETPEALRAALQEREWDVVVSDDNLPGFSSAGALAVLKETQLDLPFIIVSGAIDEERAIAAMKAGAHDYVMKGNRLRLLPAIEREVREAEQRRARRAAEQALARAAADYLTQLERRVEERTAELQRAQHAKEELLATVSHELRTPLASMLGAVELLRDGTIGDSDRRQLLDVTLAEGQRLRALIENFLSLQRMEHGWHTVTPRPTLVHDLLDHIAEDAGADTTHPIVVDVEDGVPDVLADREQITLVLSNLVSNARKYSPAGGAITLAARTAQLPNRAPAVELAVTDRGLGIPADALPRLFERFYRVDAPPHRAIPGTGLGLSICQRVVTSHGGRIWAESDGPGLGSTFRFTLPIATATGDVTFLFTDIEGSTRLWERIPDWMRNALARHDAILRQTIELHGGRVFKTIGDAFCAAFRDSSHALDAALSIQRALRSETWGEEWGVDGLRVRVALHTGPVQERDGDYFGPAVNRVARLLAAGHGGQILLSQATQDLVREALPDAVALRDMGERRLKDLTKPEHIFQVVADDLPATFPPLRSLDARRNNLPPQLTPLVGRERETEEIRVRLLEPDVRLLTLTGPGGTGKTRLSLQVAADSIDDFDHGVFFVPLAEIADPDLVPDAIALALEIREEAARPVRDTLVDALRDQHLLVVLDNMEQVVDAAPFIGDLLRACPRAKLLVSSRIELRVYGEREYPVPPLGTADAVRLFVERSRAARPDFSPTGAAADAVAQICARLDGLPLAIELAAARIRLLAPEEMLARMERSLPLLTEGARDLPARQQTLRNLIGWSWDLLDDDEKTLFRRLAAFRGAFSPDAAETVVATEHVADGLVALADKSLLRESGDESAPRFEMLQTIREYALEQLEASDEADTIHERHAAHFLTFAETARSKLSGTEQVAWLDRLEDDHDDLRAALGWWEQRRDIEHAAQLAASLWNFWLIRGHFHEGRAQLERLLALVPTDAPSTAWAQVRNGAGTLAAEQSDYDAARQHFEHSLAIWQSMGDERRVANLLLNLGGLAWRQTDYPAARDFLERSLEIMRRAGTREGVANALNNLGLVVKDQGDPAAARPYLAESLAITREVGDKRGIAHALVNLADAAVDAGDLTAARAHAEEAVALGWEVHDQRLLAEALEARACCAAAGRDPVRAMRLGAAAAALRRSIGAAPPPPQQARLDRWLEPLKTGTAAPEWAIGLALSPEAAVALALSIESASAPPDVVPPLTARPA